MVMTKADKRDYLRVANPQYQFELRRSSEAAPWALVTVGQGRFKASTIDDPSYMMELLNRRSYTLSVITFTLPVTVLDPGFSIRKVSPLATGDHRLVKVDFDYSAPEDSARRPLRSGSVLFDPSRYWTMNHVEVQTQWGNHAATETADLEYDQLADGFPVLKQTVHRRKVPGQNADIEFISQFELLNTAVQDGDFRLSAFGFPEPQGVVWQERPRWYLWFIAAGVLSLALAGFLWRRARARKGQASAAFTTSAGGHRP